MATFQTGRFFVAGASGIGFSTSVDAGRSWHAGILPGLTRVQRPDSPFDSASDPTVAYDAAHRTWLIASLPVRNDGRREPGALVSRSVDGFHWSAPVFAGPGQVESDKSWIACDDFPTSRFYGRCYLEWDDPAANGLLEMSSSLDGGLTWSDPRTTTDRATGIGGQPIVQPDGTVVVVLDDYDQTRLLAFSSRNGGASWTAPVTVAPIADHLVAAGMRTSPLPSAAVDSAGEVYAVWQDCRFRIQCASNDLLLSHSRDGAGWSRPVRIPIDATTSTVDHFIPGLSADVTTAGPHARLALAYYFFPVAKCAPATCELEVGFVSSVDGGASWSPPSLLAGAMQTDALPATRDGLMVGDYIATTFSGGMPVAAFAIAQQPQALPFNEATFVSERTPLSANLRSVRRAGLDRPIPGAVSDHTPRRPRPLF